MKIIGIMMTKLGDQNNKTFADFLLVPNEYYILMSVHTIHTSLYKCDLTKILYLTLQYMYLTLKEYIVHYLITI